MKKGTGYTLNVKNIENIKKAANVEDRSASAWLDRLLTRYFKEHPA